MRRHQANELFLIRFRHRRPQWFRSAIDLWSFHRDGGGLALSTEEMIESGWSLVHRAIWATTYLYGANFHDSTNFSQDSREATKCGGFQPRQYVGDSDKIFP